jgi:hypothetical protein
LSKNLFDSALSLVQEPGLSHAVFVIVSIIEGVSRVKQGIGSREYEKHADFLLGLASVPQRLKLCVEGGR